MAINKLVIKNYKLIKDAVIPLNLDINIFVGENDAGKSTILEALSILTTGRLISRQLSAHTMRERIRIRPGRMYGVFLIVSIMLRLKKNLPAVDSIKIYAHLLTSFFR